jgi:hypothetical protein
MPHLQAERPPVAVHQSLQEKGPVLLKETVETLDASGKKTASKMAVSSSKLTNSMACPSR